MFNIFFFHKINFCFVETVVKELETALSDVEEIDGSLKIVRSFPIVSLSFFRKLKIIRGHRSDPSERDRISEQYSLYVMDNQNLQDLFPNNVTIEKGRLFFHFNPKLCFSSILALKDHTLELKNEKTLAPNDVAANSNGDKVACKFFILFFIFFVKTLILKTFF